MLPTIEVVLTNCACKAREKMKGRSAFLVNIALVTPLRRECVTDSVEYSEEEVNRKQETGNSSEERAFFTERNFAEGRQRRR